MRGEVESAFWPAARLGEAIESAARRCGLGARAPESPGFPPEGSVDRRAVAARLAETAAWLGLEAEPVATSYRDLEPRLLRGAPALVCVGGDGGADFAAVVGRRGADLLLLAPDLRVVRVPCQSIVRRLCRGLEAPGRGDVDRLLAEAGVPEPRLASARQSVWREQLGARRVEGVFALREGPGASLWQGLRRAGALRRLALLLATHAAWYALWLLSWWVVGSAALEGHFDLGWALGWALLLASAIPFRLLATWSQGSFAVATGGILKSKLLVAALGLDPQVVRGQGMGRFVGRVIEAEAVESLALSGGILALTAVVELLFAVLVLGLGPGGAWCAGGLAAWTALVGGAGWWCLRRRSDWTRVRLGLTHDLIEKMVGHRTRLVQEERARWHHGEDAALERYLAASRRMDGASALLLAVAPRGWLLLGILGLALHDLHGGSSTPALAAFLGGILLGQQALTRLAHGLAELGGALIAWQQVLPMLRALSQGEAPGAAWWGDASRASEAAAPVGGNGRREKVLQAQDLTFCHAGRAEPVFRGLDLEVFAGDRILLEGSSGSGKSTLAALLSGLRTPAGGVVLLHGVDRQTLGAAAWRRRVAAAPQFHENHVLTETFAFNLLMGRCWPPREEDVRRAEELCGELGLGDLLARMPAGMYEMVGESGWQLSHGERSRLFMARALLQDSEVVVLDESFAALDPATLEASLRCAMRRAKTLLVIAHP